jgi:hypothetical protein
MSPTTIIDSRPLVSRPQPSRRRVEATRRPLVIRPFAAPVVREIPPRCAAAGTAW